MCQPWEVVGPRQTAPRPPHLIEAAGGGKAVAPTGLFNEIAQPQDPLQRQQFPRGGDVDESLALLTYTHTHTHTHTITGSTPS